MEQSITNILAYLIVLTDGVVKDTPKTRLEIEQAIQSILNYCNITEFPTELELSLARQMSNVYLTSDIPIGATEITEGKTRVKFSLSTDFTSITNNMRAELWTYRKLGAIV